MKNSKKKVYIAPNMKNDEVSYCPLCNHAGKPYHKTKKYQYYQCENCYGIFINKALRPDEITEKARYEEHNNDIEDENYQKFVSPISSAILKDYTQHHIGLDFGAGTGPVISKILTDNNYQIKQYDPFFHNYSELLKVKYDYIACCEVIEHFHKPYQEFALLKKLLKQNGKLYCMTHIYDEDTVFQNWYYLNDLTHVFIYHRRTLSWIKEEFNFSDLNIQERLITFYK